MPRSDVTMPPVGVMPELPRSCVVLGLGHKARQGKDTVCGLLLPIFAAAGLVARRYSFAGALYDHCRTQHGMTVKDAPLLQNVGMAVRERDPLAWVRAVAWKIADEGPDVAIITDVRFRNEADVIDQYGGLCIRVERYYRGQRVIDPSRPADHPSEVELDGWYFDDTIANDGEIEDLAPQMLRIAYIVADHRAGRMGRCV